VAQYLEKKESLFVLGKGYAEPIALEGALKIKEMCYLHAEGFSGGALKHGPFALIQVCAYKYECEIMHAYMYVYVYIRINTYVCKHMYF
jgi:hypothetical protein